MLIQSEEAVPTVLRDLQGDPVVWCQHSAGLQAQEGNKLLEELSICERHNNFNFAPVGAPPVGAPPVSVPPVSVPPVSAPSDTT